MAKKKKKEPTQYNCNECSWSKIHNKETHCSLRMVTLNEPTEYSKMDVALDCGYYKMKQI